MALAIQIEADNTGVMATYWRIRGVTIHTPPDGGDTATVTVEGYATEAARQGGKDPLLASQFSVPLSVMESQGSNALRDQIKAMLYTVVKARPEFSGASDV
jgi:hypothetical protein